MVKHRLVFLIVSYSHHMTYVSKIWLVQSINSTRLNQKHCRKGKNQRPQWTLKLLFLLILYLIFNYLGPVYNGELIFVLLKKDCSADRNWTCIHFSINTTTIDELIKDNFDYRNGEGDIGSIPPGGTIFFLFSKTSQNIPVVINYRDSNSKTCTH